MFIFEVEFDLSSGLFRNYELCAAIHRWDPGVFSWAQQLEEASPIIQVLEVAQRRHPRRAVTATAVKIVSPRNVRMSPVEIHVRW